MQVSVVIPVYKAEKYVRQAVESALIQSEVAEVVLAEDGSPDGSLAVCQALAAEDARVRVCRHPNGENRGAGESRNLAMMHTTCEWIAFLDADDYYLPGRFTHAAHLAAGDPTIEGVYELTGLYFENEVARQRWLEMGRYEHQFSRHPIPALAPSELFHWILSRGGGLVPLDGMVVRRDALQKVAGFAPLRRAEDHALRIRLAARCKLVAGNLEKPVAMCRVHDENSVTGRMPELDEVYRWHVLLWQSLLHLPDFFSPAQHNLIKHAALHDLYRNSPHKQARLPHFFRKRYILIRLAWDFPQLTRNRLFWRFLLPVPMSPTLFPGRK